MCTRGEHGANRSA